MFTQNREMDKYKKSDDIDFADLRLPDKYRFRRTELVQDSVTVETTADETANSQFCKISPVLFHPSHKTFRMNVVH